VGSLSVAGRSRHRHGSGLQTPHLDVVHLQGGAARGLLPRGQPGLVVIEFVHWPHKPEHTQRIGTCVGPGWATTWTRLQDCVGYWHRTRVGAGVRPGLATHVSRTMATDGAALWSPWLVALHGGTGRRQGRRQPRGSACRPSPPSPSPQSCILRKHLSHAWGPPHPVFRPSWL
jgi:hypothetical protein